MYLPKHDPELRHVVISPDMAPTYNCKGRGKRAGPRSHAYGSLGVPSWYQKTPPNWYQRSDIGKSHGKGSTSCREGPRGNTAIGKGHGKGGPRIPDLCLQYAIGKCEHVGDDCPMGKHFHPEAPHESTVFLKISSAKKKLIQQKWQDAGGSDVLVDAWQVRNSKLDMLFRASECDFARTLGRTSDVINAWHGTPEDNVWPIAFSGFDTSRRSGQVFGDGEYFAKDPNVSINYARGGAFLFLCKLLLGSPDVDHTWVDRQKYYVIKQRDGRVQALPLFLVQFNASSGNLTHRLAELKLFDQELQSTLSSKQRGGDRPCEARPDAGMEAATTQQLWIGWLDPSLLVQDRDAVESDVRSFLRGYDVESIDEERNGSRIGAFVLLRTPITKSDYVQLSQRMYRNQFKITVDDAQLSNPRCKGKLCPRLAGPSRYCRGWNVRGHHNWRWGCSFEHPRERWPTYNAKYALEDVPVGSAKFDEIATELTRVTPFASADGRGQPQIISVSRVVNKALTQIFDQRRKFLHEKQGQIMEIELWHGTNCKAIPELLNHGLQPPSDTEPSNLCPRSGNKGLCTTLCGTDCKYCVVPHTWDHCHMFGHGIYLADQASKSHRYVREPEGTLNGSPVYSLIRCRVVLGNPFLIEGNLLTQNAMHDLVWCSNPTDALETTVETWNMAKGHDAFYVRGLAGAQRAGLGVYNSEYIVFQPWQVLPLYKVEYCLA